MTKPNFSHILKAALTASLLLVSLLLSARSWKEISSSGTLRVLILEADRASASGNGLHRVEMPIDRQRALLRRFAREHKLKIEYHSALEFKTLFAMLDAGKGDLIASSLAETPARKKRYLLSAPFFVTREMIFTAKGSRMRGSDASALKGRTGRVLPGTSYAANLRALAGRNKAVRFQELPGSISHEELIDRVASGKIDYSVLNECDLDAWLAFRPDIRKLFPLHRRVPLVFAAGKNDTVLISRLNKFIAGYLSPQKSAQQTDTPQKSAPQKTAAQPSPKSGAGKALPSAPSPAPAPEPEESADQPDDTSPYYEAKQIISSRMTGDLDAIKRRGYLRMLTSNNAFCCYLHGGERAGFEYELVSRFAEALDVEVVTVIPENFEELPQYLADGRGDVIAANFTRSDERMKAHSKLTFCAPYLPVQQVLVGRPGEKIRTIADLNGRKIHVLQGSAYEDTLRELQAKGAQFQIISAPDGEETLSLIRSVASGQYDLTVADESFFKMAVEGGCKVRSLMTIGKQQSYSWVVRKGNPKLAKAIDAFFHKENRGTFFNLCRKRYFSPKTSRARAPYEFKDKKLVISPYDEIFRKYAKLYDFHWCFLAAQAFQESRFQADRVNHIGAAGLMQVRPSTAKELGVTDLTRPENGVCAGVRYLDKMRKRFPETISLENRLCFSLAAYNAGYGHVQDARKLAVQQKLNPDVWFNNTEKAMMMLEKPKYYSRAKFGYCRASETVPYVQDIVLNAYHYRQMLELNDQKTKDAAPAQKR